MQQIRGIVSMHLMMISMSMMGSIPVLISWSMGVSCLAYLSSGLMWDILAYLGCYWGALFNWNLKWNLSFDWVADLSWLIMASGRSWDDFGSVDTLSSGD